MGSVTKIYKISATAKCFVLLAYGRLTLFNGEVTLVKK
jgi:hypothetical protein